MGLLLVAVSVGIAVAISFEAKDEKVVAEAYLMIIGLVFVSFMLFYEAFRAWRVLRACSETGSAILGHYEGVGRGE